MVTIIRDVSVIPTYVLSTFVKGDFFEYNNKFCMIIRYDPPDDVNVLCFNFTDIITVNVPPDYMVYKATPVEIKYNLYTGEE